MKNKLDLLKIINKKLRKTKLHLMNIKELNVIILDTSRIMDKLIVQIINDIKTDLKINLDSDQRKSIRLYLLGYPDSQKKQLRKYRDLVSNYISKQILNKAYSFILHGISKKSNAVIDTIISRYKIYFLHMNNDVYSKYLKYIKTLQKHKYQLFYLNINANNKLTSNDINNFITKFYSKLSNYHNCILTFIDTKDHKIKWNTIAKVAIYMENFLLEKKFHVFQNRNRSRRINDLIKFLSNNQDIKNTEQLQEVVKKFYQGVSYGFQFVDLFISKDGSKKSLVMQKVKLDESPKRCPACFHKKVRGNSYSKVLFKSFECQNPKCPARSKSGRGKRFDLLSAKRQIMLKRGDYQDKVSDNLYKSMRRDITNNKSLCSNTMIKLYTWAGDHVLIVNAKNRHKFYQGRSIKNTQLIHLQQPNLFKNLLIVKLFKSIYQHIQFNDKPTNIDKRINGNILDINDNSMNIGYYKHKYDLTIKSAITSPPYYNAREYSQWKNFLCYLVDMMIDSKAVYDALDNHSIYIYNVGDVVDLDYVYIKSHMSQCRLMLGFYSALIFNIVGFNLKNDIIWDKGEVQSKRNSSPNHFAGYLKPVNSYEHNLVFCKGTYTNNKKLLDNKIIYIPPVKKINSRGKNTYGHSAPFPKGIAKLILPFSHKVGYILDPFLGSGTTCIVANDYNYKSLGFELNKKYYKLSINKIKNQQLSLFNTI